MNEVKEIEDRIQELERQRSDELDDRKWMASCPERTNSYGRYQLMEKSVNEKYDKMTNSLQKDVDALKGRSLTEPISPENENCRYSKKRRKKVACEERQMGNSEYATKDDGNESVESSFSYVSSKSSGDDEDTSIATEDKNETRENYDIEGESDEDGNPKTGSAKKKKQQNEQDDDVIEIDDSDSDYDDSNSSSSDEQSKKNNDSVVAEYNNSEDEKSSVDSENNDKDDSSVTSENSKDEESCIHQDSNSTMNDEDDASASRHEEGLQSKHFDSNNNTMNDDKDEMGTNNENDGFSFEPDYNFSDEDDNDNEIERYYVSKIKQSKLTMAAQGFRCSANGPDRSPAAEANNEASIARRTSNFIPFDPSSVQYDGRTFHKNDCYILKGVGGNGDVTVVGIRRFLSNDTAECILIERFDDTIIGTEDEGLEYRAVYLLGTHVQIHKCIENLSLSKLESESEDVTTIPRLIYEPQTPGNWYTFGYFYDRTEMQRNGKRQSMRSLELFAGAGGSLIGYHNNGFETAMSVENDKDAVRTLKENNPGLKVYEGCIRKFIRDYDTLKCALGRIDHIHFSSPCQDFSSANRSQATGPRDRADLSLLLVDLVRMTSCSTAVFENVVGIWRRKSVHYLKNITKGLLQLGYQVRCTVLRACDYGDPQKRPRFFMFISKANVPMPQFPAKTHGPGPNHLWPYVTVKDALSRVADNDSLPNMEGRTTTVRPGQHGVIRLNGYDVAPTIRASAVTPFHMSQDRCINVREAARLQSFPLEYRFSGSVSSQYKQVGNAVPVELSTAVAQSIRQILIYDYKEANEE